VSRIDQNILYQFLAKGHFERHLNRMRAIYKSKHDVLLNAIRPLEKQFVVQGENAGIHILMTDRVGRTEEELVLLAARAGVKVYGISGYYIGPVSEENASTVVLGYASLGEDRIEEGARLLRECWTE